MRTCNNVSMHMPRTKISRACSFHLCLRMHQIHVHTYLTDALNGPVKMHIFAEITIRIMRFFNPLSNIYIFKARLL